MAAAPPSAQAADTNAAPAQAGAPTSGVETFPQYLADHEDELAPIFEAHADDLVKQGLPVLLLAIGNFILLYLIVSWGFDMGLSFGFSAIFAPAYSKFKLAVIYATGRIVITIFIGILTFLAFLGVIAVHSIILLVLVWAFMTLLDFAIQSFWVGTIFRTRILVSALFYLGLLTLHFIATTLVLGPLVKTRVSVMLTNFVDQNVTGQITQATADSQKDLAAAAADRDKIKARVTETQQDLDQANADQAKIAQEIDDKKNSEAFLYARIVHVRAQGDLTGARDQFTAFLAKFPSGSLKTQATEQVTEINAELAAQEAARKQAQADAAAAAAQARADLLARAAKGEATLSEMRDALIGQTRDQVTALFGPPSKPLPIAGVTAGP